MGNVSKLLLNPGSPASAPSFPALTNEGDNRIVGGVERFGRNVKETTDMWNDVSWPAAECEGCAQGGE